MTYQLFNVTDGLVHNPGFIAETQARDFDSAFVKFKQKLSTGTKEQLGLSETMKIQFTALKQDISLGYGDAVKYTTCSIEDGNGFVVDTYDYAIMLVK